MRTRNYFIVFLLGCIGTMALLQTKVNPLESKTEESYMPDTITIQNKYEHGKTRGYDYKTKKYIPYLTDEEIRLMRENNPEYIIKVPGRQIKNRRQISEQQIEDYIEEHPELLDEFKD